MFGIILSILMTAFGIYLKISNNPGFATSKKYAWLFIALGVVTLIGRIVNMYLKN
ncbi:hypothetical protein [Chryseobacterium sp. T1]